MTHPVRADVVVIAGLAGSGKSSIARALSRQQVWPFFDKDNNNDLLEAGLEAAGSSASDRSSPTYLGTFRPREYSTLLRNVISNVGTGISCIVDAPLGREFDDAAWRGKFQRDCMAAGGGPVAIHYVWVTARSAIHRQRLAERGEARDLDKLVDWDSWRNASGAEPLQPCLVLDNSEPGGEARRAAEIVRHFGLPHPAARINPLADLHRKRPAMAKPNP